MQSGEWIEINGREYRLGSVLSTSAGSYGEVWAATDAAGCAVALKFINAAAMSQADASLHGYWRAHLEREIAFLASLDPSRSRHVVTLLDHGQLDEQPVLVLERLQANLGEWLAWQRRNGAPPPDLSRILDWVGQILDGLDVIHHAGFVYRDLKFSNILVGDQGALLKLADFGSLKRENGDSTRSCIGTPATMAPEQILPVRHGAEGCEYAVDYRADYYALGLILFTLLTEQSTTAAQRRLGQLLALHGQEGASQRRDQLGGLTLEEQDLLQRSIELWTVPVRPEQGQGRAMRLTDLIIQLLACDPAARPASSTAIRAALSAVRTDQASTPDLLADGLTLPPDTPPNRLSRRPRSPVGAPRLRRTLGLVGALGLASVLAWATIIRPVFHQSATESLHSAPTPPSSVDLAIPSPAQAPKSTASTATATTAPTRPSQAPAETPTESPAATTAETIRQRPAETAAATATNASDEATQSTAATATPAPAATTTEVGTEVSEESTTAATESPTTPTTEAATPSGADAVANSRKPASLANHARRGYPPSSPKPTRVVNPPKSIIAAPVERSASASHPKTTRTKTIHRETEFIATPEESSHPKAPRTKTVRAMPPADEESTPRTKTVRATPPVDEESIATPRAPTPPPIHTPRIAKPAPKPAAPTVMVSPPTPKIKAAPTTPTVASRQPTPRAQVAPTPRLRNEKPASAATHTNLARKAAPPAAPLAKTVHTTPAAASLPPIKLIANSRAATGTAAPTPAPIELISRASPTPRTSTPPPIELVSRSAPTSTAAPIRAASPAPAPRRSAGASPSQPSTRAADSITAFQKDAGQAVNSVRREAENIGNWVSRLGSSVGTEIQRGLDHAHQTTSSWIGTCPSGNHCQSAQRVERRDRWSRRNSAETATRP